MEVSAGFLLCLVAAACWGITEGLAKIVVRHMEPLVFTWGRCMLLAPVFLVTASADGLVLPPTGALWAGVIGIALAGPVLARYLYMKSLTLLPVSKAALINQLQPIWVALLAGLIFQSIPTLKECIGGVMIIAGCMLLVRRKSQR
jgi:drug/metabolite transporter (DMT)-like permease